MSGEINNAARILGNQVREEALKDLSSIFTKWMMEMGMFNTCLNCGHWQDNPEMCLKFKQRPPAKIIVVGCSEHTDIPF